MPLFEVVILELPTQKQAEEGKLERLVLGPEPMIAADPQGAAVSVAMDKASEIKVDRSRMKVLVRPFE